jgi:hypothetical protein
MKSIAIMMLLGVPALAAAAESKGMEGKVGGRSVDGRPLVMVGQGVRVRAGEKLYEMQMWIDEVDGKRAFPALAMRAGGRDRKKLTKAMHASDFLVWGRFNKQAVFTFTRAVSAATMRDEIKGALEALTGSDVVLAMLVDAAAGDEWVLTTRDNGEIELKVGEQKKQGPQSPKLQRALWSVWFGSHPVSIDLRQQLIERVDLLGK